MFGIYVIMMMTIIQTILKVRLILAFWFVIVVVVVIVVCVVCCVLCVCVCVCVLFPCNYFKRKISVVCRKYKAWNKPVSQSCTVAKREIFWRATGQSFLADRVEDCSIVQSAVE